MTPKQFYWWLIPCATAMLCFPAPIVIGTAVATTVASPATARVSKCDSALSRLMVVAEVLRPLDSSANLSAKDANHLLSVED